MLPNVLSESELFAFKTVEDVMEENVRLKSEVNWLNDIITKNITELQEKVSKQNLDITTNKDSISTQSQDIADNKKSIDMTTDDYQ